MSAQGKKSVLQVLSHNRRLLLAAVVSSLLLHAFFATIYLWPEREEDEEVLVARIEWDDQDTPFHIPAPQVSREFTFRREAVPEGAPVVRSAGDRTATVVRGRRGVGVRDQAMAGSGMRWSETGGGTEFIAAVGDGGLGDMVVGIPEFEAVEMVTMRDPERRIDMQAEFLDLSAIDTGQYRGMVIQDPEDRQNIRGFVYLGLAWGSILEPSRKRSISQLVRAINNYTQIEARVDDQMFLDSQDLFKAPFVYITTNRAFELTAHEIRNLSEYLRSGGFLMVDNDTPHLEYGPAEASLREMLRQALGRSARFVPISNDHPIYHSFFDFDDGPPPGGQVVSSTARRSVYYLEGLYLGDRLVAVYSNYGYGAFWERETENEPHLRMGINLVVFALTQRGSIAQQQIDFYQHAN